MPEAARDIQGLVERCALPGDGCREFAHTFRPDTFFVPTIMDEDMQKFLRLISDPSISHALIIAHRGWGKTSWMQTEVERRLFYRLTNCLLWCSLSLTAAQQDTESIKWDLETNRQAQAVFGDMKSDKWAQEEWQTRALHDENGDELHPGTQIVPRGVGQQVRGWLYKGRYRPDLIVVNDIQDRKTVKSETLRDEAWRWVTGEIMGCFSQLDTLGPKENPPKLVVIGNMLHEDCVVNRLLEESKKPGSVWGDNVLVLPMCDDNLKSRRPTFISDAKVKQIYTQYKNSGDLDTFAQEYQEEVVSEVSRKFRDEYYRYYDETVENLNRRGGVETVVCVDVTNTKKSGSCPAGIVVQTVDLITSSIFVREVIQEQMHPDEQYNTAIDLAVRYGAHCISCGTQGAKEWVTYAFENAIRERHVPVEFVEIPETRREGAKEERIAGLVPLYRTGHILHSGHTEPDGTWTSHCIPLELAQRKFPHSRYFDTMDAQSQILWLLDNSERFMHGGEDFAEGASEDEYDELEADMAAEDEVLDWKVRI